MTKRRKETEREETRDQYEEDGTVHEMQRNRMYRDRDGEIETEPVRQSE